MTRTINISEDTIEGEIVRKVTVIVNGVTRREFYSYPSGDTPSNAEIETEVNADLDSKGIPS